MNAPTTENRYLICLPVTAADLPAAARIARAIARSLSFHQLIDYDHTTVCVAGRADEAHPAFCRRRLPDGRHCLLRPDHDGPCTRRPPR